MLKEFVTSTCIEPTSREKAEDQEETWCYHMAVDFTIDITTCTKQNAFASGFLAG